MLCKPDGSDKHDRWFWVDADNHTLSWGKKPRVAAKGPFVLTGVEEYAGGRLKFVTDGEAAVVKPADDAVYQLWLRGCRAVLKWESKEKQVHTESHQFLVMSRCLSDSAACDVQEVDHQCQNGPNKAKASIG